MYMHMRPLCCDCSVDPAWMLQGVLRLASEFFGCVGKISNAHTVCNFQQGWAMSIIMGSSPAMTHAWRILFSNHTCHSLFSFNQYCARVLLKLLCRFMITANLKI